MSVMGKALLKNFRIGSDVIDAVADSLELEKEMAEPITIVFPSASVGTPDETPPPVGSKQNNLEDKALSFVSEVSLRSVADWFRRNLEASEDAKAYLERRKIADWTILERLECGYSDGSLSSSLSVVQRSGLKECGILDKTGSEVFTGCLVFPLKNSSGEIVSFYGHKIDDSVVSKNVFLQGNIRGLVNREVLSLWREEIILTENVLDAVSFLVMGIERVLPCYGKDGFTDEHLSALKDAHVKKVVLAFASIHLASRLANEGFAVSTIACEDGKDWNEAFLNGCTKEDIGILVSEAAVTEAKCITRWDWNASGKRWELFKDGITYKAMGSTKRLGSSMRLSVRIERDGKRFLDHVDLYSARSRLSFREQSALALGVEGAVVEQDLLSLLDQLEAEAEESDEKMNASPPLTSEERALGLTLLESKTIFEDIVRDMEELGHVGEDANKLLVYLAASSRKLSSPVSVVVASASAAGKSFLIDTVRRLMPSDDVVNLTSLSDQALNYMGEGTLMHKLLILGEAVHNEVVEHQIREMLSSRCLSRMVVTKDEKTGKLSSSLVKQDALVSLMMSTTRASMNAENASRYLLVHADESDEQTKRIHERQNRAYTFDAMKRNADTVPFIIRKHIAAQRLLENITIVNPYSSDTEFPYRLMRSRRDNKQLQDLVSSVCFLRQYQKEKKTRDGITFIECDEADVETAWSLFRIAVMKASFLELPESLVRLYEDIRVLCRSIADSSGITSLEVKFDQGQLRRRIHYLGAESVKKYLRLLVSLEYIAFSGNGVRGQRARYQLIADESLEVMAGFDEITKSG